MSALALGWSLLEPPRTPVAVLAFDEHTLELADSAERLLEVGAELRVCLGDRALLVVGAEQVLPWSDGATYLGREAGVLLPTTLTPDLPADLVAQAAAQYAGAQVDGQLVVLPGRLLVFTLSDAPLGAGDLAGHLERARS